MVLDNTLHIICLVINNKDNALHKIVKIYDIWCMYNIVCVIPDDMIKIIFVVFDVTKLCMWCLTPTVVL